MNLKNGTRLHGMTVLTLCAAVFTHQNHAKISLTNTEAMPEFHPDWQGLHPSRTSKLLHKLLLLMPLAPLTEVKSKVIAYGLETSKFWRTHQERDIIRKVELIGNRLLLNLGKQL